MREEVNFLIGFQSHLFPGGLYCRKSVVVAWVEMSLWVQKVDLVRPVDGRERYHGLVCVCVCVYCIETQRALTSIKCVKTDVSRLATYLSCLAHFSITTVRHVVYHREGKRLISEPVYVGFATACKTLPWRKGSAICISCWFYLASLYIITAVDLTLSMASW